MDKLGIQGSLCVEISLSYYFGLHITPVTSGILSCPQETIKTITDQEGKRLQKLVQDTFKEERETSKVKLLNCQTISFLHFSCLLGWFG